MVCVLAICSLITHRDGPTTSVYVAVSRISPGVGVTEVQVRKTPVPSALVPVGAITSLEGLSDQMTTGPVAAGAILTEDDFVASAQADAGFVILPLTVSTQMLTVLRPGDHVSIYMSNPATGEVGVARGVRVVTMPTNSSSGLFTSSGGDNFILVEVPDDVAATMNAAGGMGSTTVAIE